VQFIAIFQIGVLALVMFLPQSGMGAFLELLRLDMELVMKGEVWRLVTHLCVPETQNPIFAVIGALFLMFCSRALEEVWGPFRVNLYVLAWALVMMACNALFGWPSLTIFFAQSIFFAFATLFPDEEIMLFGVLPVKAKWLAWINAGYLFFLVVKAPPLLLFIAAGHLNYLGVFLPSFIRGGFHSAKVSQRRARFAAAAAPESDVFHRCSVCGKTEQDDATLEFRVLTSGDEICSECRKKA
jgi:hypothetical protein